MESVIVDQASMIEEYHNQLKSAIERNERLEKQLQFEQKDNAVSKSFISVKTSTGKKKKKDSNLGKSNTMKIAEYSTNEGK